MQPNDKDEGWLTGRLYFNRKDKRVIIKRPQSGFGYTMNLGNKLVFNATIQSAQPIISYNYGCGLLHRSKQALRYALYFAIGFAAIMMIVFLFQSQLVVDLFIPDKNNPAWGYADKGLPYFSADFIFLGINTIMIGYYMSLETLRKAVAYTLIRGILPVICFYVLPLWFGVSVLWMSVATADIITTFVIVATSLTKRTIVNSGNAVKQA